MRGSRVWMAFAGLLLAAAGPVSAGVEPFPVSFLPASVVADSGASFSVGLEADSGAAQFNAYEVTISFDPAMLAFEGVTQGALMLGACGHTIWFKTQTESTVTYSHSLLCADTSLDGPGELSRYTFRALASGVTTLAIVSSQDSSFFDAGIFINPSHPTRPRQVSFGEVAVVVGTDPTGAPRPEATPGLRLDVVPNPLRGTGRVLFDTPRPGPVELETIDVAGRVVRHRAWAELPSGRHEAAWSDRTDDGRPLPPGVYFVRLTHSAGSRAVKIALVR